MTWDAYHRRRKTLREMLEIADEHRELTIVDLLDVVDESHDAFASTDEVLFELQATWFQRLSGHIDRLLAEGHETPELIAVTAWVDTAADLPGARNLLDDHRDEPALRKAFAKELAYLATSAGVPTRDLDVVAQGQRIQDAAREAVDGLPTAPLDPPRRSFMARLRDVIAA